MTPHPKRWTSTTIIVVLGVFVILIVLIVVVSILLSLTRTGGRSDVAPVSPIPLTILSKFSDLNIDSSCIWQLPRLQTPRECGLILEDAEAIGFVASQVKHYKTEDSSRKSMTCWIHPTKSKHVASLYDIISRLLGIAPSRFESLQIVKYTPEQYFKWHYDACDPGETWCQDQIQRFGGQRLFTVLLYLNDAYEGGETQFVGNDLKIRGRTGDAIVFRNVTKGKIEPRSLHQGCQVTKGTKYIANVWIRG